MEGNEGLPQPLIESKKSEAPQTIILRRWGEHLTSQVNGALEARGLGQEYGLEILVQMGDNALDVLGLEGNELEAMEVDQLRELMADKGLRVALYNGGIGIGIEGNDSETIQQENGPIRVHTEEEGVTTRKVKKMRMQRILRRMGKREDKGSAEMFLFEHDLADVVMTVYPKKLEDNAVLESSLAASMTARMVLLEHLRGEVMVGNNGDGIDTEAGAVGEKRAKPILPEIYDWSHKGYQEYMVWAHAKVKVAFGIEQGLKRGVLNEGFGLKEVGAFFRKLHEQNLQWSDWEPLPGTVMPVFEDYYQAF